jgi:hypothetical protein
MTDRSPIQNDNIECPLCLGQEQLTRTEVLERLGMKDFARVAQLPHSSGRGQGGALAGSKGLESISRPTKKNGTHNFGSWQTFVTNSLQPHVVMVRGFQTSST